MEIYWIELSDYDLDTAYAMLSTGRNLYVGFMCHQVIEKIFKAYYCKIHNENAPYTHSLALLANKSGLYSELPEIMRDFIDELEPMNIEARYPTYKEKLLKSLNQEKCVELIKTTKELQLCVKLKIS